jgi:hypothetical protein
MLFLQFFDQILFKQFSFSIFFDFYFFYSIVVQLVFTQKRLQTIKRFIQNIIKIILTFFDLSMNGMKGWKGYFEKSKEYKRKFAAKQLLLFNFYASIELILMKISKYINVFNWYAEYNLSEALKLCQTHWKRLSLNLKNKFPDFHDLNTDFKKLLKINHTLLKKNQLEFSHNTDIKTWINLKPYL